MSFYSDPSNGFNGVVMAEVRGRCLKYECGGVKKWNQDMKGSFFFLF